MAAVMPKMFGTDAFKGTRGSNMPLGVLGANELFV
jgi:hypothetical protein